MNVPSIDELRHAERANVFKDTALIGTLERTANGARFTYADDYLAGEGVSYTMPPTTRRYDVAGYNLHPFFAGLLPEGLRLTALVRAAKTSADDLFSLLLAGSQDTVGDISLALTDTVTRERHPTITSLAEVNFAELFDQSISATDPRLRRTDMTVAGVQPKVSAAMISFPVGLRSRSRQFILKLTPAEYPRLVENEHFFMQLAARCGIEAASTKLIHDRDGHAGLLVERFDRVKRPGSRDTMRVHQEDACQLLNRYPADKYRVSFGDIAEALTRYASAPIVELERLLRIVAYSYVIGNGDLHAKNVSLRTDPSSGRVVLTPAYDLISTFPYGDRKMALMFEGRDDNIKRRDFVACGERHGVLGRVTNRLLDEVLAGVRGGIVSLQEIGLTERESRALGALIDKRIRDISRDE